MKKLLIATALVAFSSVSMASTTAVQSLKADPYSQTTKDFIVSDIQETHRHAPISQELVGDIVSCQYDTIVDQYGGVVSDEQLVNGLVGLAAFHDSRLNRVDGNFLTNEDYYNTLDMCNSRYEYSIRKELKENR